MSARRQLSHEETPSLSHTADVVLILDGIIQSQNIGLLLRSANAFGVKEVWIRTDELTELSDKAKKVSRLGKSMMPVHFVAEIGGIKERLVQQQRLLLGVELSADQVWLPAYSFPKMPLALALGAEREGMSPDMMGLCEQMLAIPLFGSVSSLNVATAGAIALYELARQSNHWE